MIPPFLIKPALYVAVTAAAVAIWFTWLNAYHDPAVRAAYRAEIDADTAKQVAANQVAALAALADTASEDRVRDAFRTTIRERIIHVPVTTACAASPAVRAALDGLRGGAGGAGAAGGPAVAPGLSGAARAPATAVR